MQGAEECRLRRTSSTPQVELAKSRRFLSGREATEGNAADDTLMVDQGHQPFLDQNKVLLYYYQIIFTAVDLL